jgi:uncharacterized protein YecT (DUF1311 family)
MSSSPATTPITTSLSLIGRASKYFKLHETLIIILASFTLLWFVSGKIEGVIAAHDAVNLATTKATLAAQVQTNNDRQALIAQQAADYKALAAKYQAQDAALAQANVALAQALTAQQKKDAALPIPQLVTRWIQLVPDAGVSVAANGTVSVSEVGAHATVNELEKVPVLTTELANEKQVCSNTSTLLDAANGRVVTLNSQVDGLKLQSKDADNVCKAQIAVVKADARKSKRRWFVIGFISGFVSRQAIKTYTGF